MINNNEFIINFQGTPIKAKKGESLMHALSEKGIFLRADCGGNGRCTKCSVKIIQDFPESQKDLKNIDKSTGIIGTNYRNVLACQETVTKNLVVEIFQAAMLSPDIIQKPQVSQKLISRISGLLKGRDSFSENCAAIDLGTTTIAVYICNMEKASVIGSVSLKNPQTLFGQDVMSRITAVSENPMILTRLQQMIVQAVDWGIRQICLIDNLNPKSIRRMSIVGNSVMLHLLLGRNPLSMGTIPYKPEFYKIQKISAGRLGFNFNYDAELFTLPLISGFLGADIVAASIAADLKNAPFGTFLADLGTNGEIMAVGRQSMIATSCAMGPSLEGAAIEHGMPAVSGAISSVSINKKRGQVKYSVKGNKLPSGICGSGIISAVAELLRAKILLPDGRFDQSAGCDRLRLNHKNIPEFVLVPENESGTGKMITLTQTDIRNVQLAKGAFRTGIDFLCDKIGVKVPKRLLIAGTFGNYIEKQDALIIGMFPPMPDQNIQNIGNAAGEGAILSLFDPESLLQADELARTTQVMNLASQKDFQDHFVDSLSFAQP
jgi:uncharacterized 2Fe-2S/4Fe-4S cluster protein (DUF4445 family)